MKTAHLKVPSPEEIERIHAASMEVLATVGVKVDYKTARDLFRQAGAEVDTELAKVPDAVPGIANEGRIRRTGPSTGRATIRFG